MTVVKRIIKKKVSVHFEVYLSLFEVGAKAGNYVH